jgi:hypothetical protein
LFRQAKHGARWGFAARNPADKEAGR